MRTAVLFLVVLFSAGCHQADSAFEPLLSFPPHDPQAVLPTQYPPGEYRLVQELPSAPDRSLWRFSAQGHQVHLGFRSYEHGAIHAFVDADLMELEPGLYRWEYRERTLEDDVREAVAKNANPEKIVDGAVQAAVVIGWTGLLGYIEEVCTRGSCP